MTKTTVIIYIVNNDIDQNKQNIFCFRLKTLAPTTANQTEEKKLTEKEKARNHMRELGLKRKNDAKLKRKEMKA